MRRFAAVLAALALVAPWAWASPGRFTAQLQLGASMIGAGEQPRFSLGWFGTTVDSSIGQQWSGDFDAVVSRATYLRGLLAYRPLTWLACLLSLDVGLPIGHLERHDAQMGAYFGLSSSRPEVPLGVEGYLFTPAIGARVYFRTGPTEPYVEVVQGYVWQVVDVWWDPSGVQLPGFSYRVHHRHRNDRATMRLAAGLAHALSPRTQFHLAVELISTREGEGGWYFLDWEGLHQQIGLSLGVSYAF